MIISEFGLFASKMEKSSRHIATIGHISQALTKFKAALRFDWRSFATAKFEEFIFALVAMTPFFLQKYSEESESNK